MSRVEQLQELENGVCKLFARENINYEKAYVEYGLVGSLIKIEDAEMAIEEKVNLEFDTGDLLVTDYASFRDELLDLHTFAAIALIMLDKKELEEKTVKKTVVDELSPLPLPLVNPVTPQSTNNMIIVGQPILVELPPYNEDAALKEAALENARKQLSQAEDERRREQKEQKSSHKYEVGSKKPILHVKKEKKRWSHLKLWRA